MSYEEHTARIERLTFLIKCERTGTAEELARKLDVSRRTIFNDLEFLKGKGWMIIFNRNINSYTFTQNKK